MTPAQLVGSPFHVAIGARTPEADARMWLLSPDDRIAALAEGRDAWTERMRARWDEARRCGWSVWSTEYREREACAAAWTEFCGEAK